MNECMARTLCAATVAVVFAGPAAAGVVDIQWSDSGAAAQEFRVEPGKFAEWCGKLRKGEKITWRFEAGAPLDFNIHYHEGKDVRFPAKQDGTAKAEGTLEVAVDQDYCWMWSGKGAAAAAVKATLLRVR